MGWNIQAEGLALKEEEWLEPQTSNQKKDQGAQAFA